MPAFIRSAKRRWASPDYPVASRDSMLARAEEGSRATGQSLDEAAVVVEDLERAAAALSTRTAPLVPACGVLVATAGLLLRGRLLRKHACTYRGGWPAGIGLACLILGILIGVRITLGTG